MIFFYFFFTPAGSKLAEAMLEGQDSFNRFINDNAFAEFREGVAQIEDDHKPDKGDLQPPIQPESIRRLPRKRTRFDEPIIVPMDSNTNTTNIPSLLNIAVEAPPDIEIDLSDLRSDDEDGLGDNNGRAGNGEEDENWDMY